MLFGRSPFMKIFSRKKSIRKNAFHLRAQKVRSKQRACNWEGHCGQNVVRVRYASLDQLLSKYIWLKSWAPKFCWKNSMSRDYSIEYVCDIQENPSSQVLPIIAKNLSFHHGLRTPGEEIAFTARPKIHSHSQIFKYGRSIFCLPHRPKFSIFFDLCLHWVSVLRGFHYSCGPLLTTLSGFKGTSLG